MSGAVFDKLITKPYGCVVNLPKLTTSDPRKICPDCHRGVMDRVIIDAQHGGKWDRYLCRSCGCRVDYYIEFESEHKRSYNFTPGNKHAPRNMEM